MPMLQCLNTRCRTDMLRLSTDHSMLKHFTSHAPAYHCRLEHCHVLLEIHHNHIEYSPLHSRVTSSVLSTTVNASRAPTHGFSRIRTYLGHCYWTAKYLSLCLPPPTHFTQARTNTSSNAHTSEPPDHTTLLGYFSSPILCGPHGATLFCPLHACTTLTPTRWQH